MRRYSISKLAGAIALLVALAATADAEPRVEFELVMEPGLPVTGAQTWLATLKDLGLTGIRIRSFRAADKFAITTRGSGERVVYHVRGLLTSGNVLRLPAGKFTLRDKARISQWLEKLKEGGPEALTAKPAAFGLTDRQLAAVHDGLRVPVTSSTSGQRPKDVVRQIARNLDLSLVVDSSVRGQFDTGETVADELQGIASGTALAALLRPMGLVLVPQKKRGAEVRLVVTAGDKGAESWPVGWKPDKKPRDVIPVLFEFLKIEIQNIPLSQASDAIQKRLKVPFLMDHAALARHGIDPTKRNVSLPAKRTYYKRALDRLLSQAQLRGEVRVDEAGQPIMWISTIKP